MKFKPSIIPATILVAGLASVAVIPAAQAQPTTKPSVTSQTQNVDTKAPNDLTKKVEASKLSLFADSLDATKPNTLGYPSASRVWGGKATANKAVTKAASGSTRSKSVAVLVGSKSKKFTKLSPVGTANETKETLRHLSAPVKPMTPSSAFGWRVSPMKLNDTGRDFHTGQDFAAICGTEVDAVAAGTVVRAYWHPGGGGNRVEIDHGYGVITTYNHLKGYNVKAGDKVTRGQKIAEVGTTGSSTGCHLHFELWLGGQLTDPMPWLNGAGDPFDDKTYDPMVSVPAASAAGGEKTNGEMTVTAPTPVKATSKAPAAKAKPTPVKPKPAPVKVKPAPVRVTPAPRPVVKPKPAPVKVKPVPAPAPKPAPVIVKPTPKPTPVPVVPKPTPTPTPVPTVPAPTPVPTTPAPTPTPSPTKTSAVPTPSPSVSVAP